MRILIKKYVPMGLPERLQGQVVEAVKQGDGYRLTARQNSHLVLSERRLRDGSAEIVEEVSDADYSIPFQYP